MLEVRSKAAVFTSINLEDLFLKPYCQSTNDIIDVVDINAIESTYSNEGCPAYHPDLF